MTTTTTTTTADLPPRPGVETQRRLLRRTGAIRRHLGAAGLLGTATAAVITAIGWWLARVVAGVVADPSALSAAYGALAVVAGLFVLRALLAWAQSAVAGRGSAAVRDELRQELITARLAGGEATGATGELVWRAGAGIDAIDGYLTRYLPALVLAVTVPLVVGVAVLGADPLSALIIALTIPLIPVFMILIGWTTRDVVGRRWRIQSRLAHHFADLVAGLPTLQVFGRARAQVVGLQRIGDADRRETMAALRMALLSALVLELIATLSMALVAVAIGLRLVTGDLDLVTGLFVLIVAPEVYLALRRVGAAFHDSADGLAAVEAVAAVVDAAPRRSTASTGGAAGASPIGDAVIDVIGLGVAGSDGRPRLPGLTVRIEPGSLTVLTGDSGAGKSTALGVLTGAIAPTRGAVLIGEDWCAVPDGSTTPDRRRSVTDHREAWLSRLAWVPQAPTLIAGTVADNLALAAPVATTEQLRTALDASGGAELGLDRRVGVRNDGLSAGEIRRVAVARALLRLDYAGAELMIMDEPTAGLDAATEATVIAEVIGRGVTAVVVSHRPAVIAAADRVVRL